MKDVIVTIDGPAGSGKTTVSKILAARLGYKYIDTGALYRGVALGVILNKVDSDDEEALGKFCTTLDLLPVVKEAGMILLLNGEDVTSRIRDPEVTMMASKISARPGVRSFLLGLQKQFGADKRAVFEGRDMGTVVFPHADIKFFLMASPEKRAARRFAEMPQDCGQSLGDVERDMIIRDENDSTRKSSPLRAADDAVLIDSTSMDIGAVVEKMLKLIDPLIG